MLKGRREWDWVVFRVFGSGHLTRPFDLNSPTPSPPTDLRLIPRYNGRPPSPVDLGNPRKGCRLRFQNIPFGHGHRETRTTVKVFRGTSGRILQTPLVRPLHRVGGVRRTDRGRGNREVSEGSRVTCVDNRHLVTEGGVLSSSSLSRGRPRGEGSGRARDPLVL